MNIIIITIMCEVSIQPSVCIHILYIYTYVHIQCRMLDKDPHKRPSAVSILHEPFLQQRMQVSILSSVLLVGR